MTVLDVYVNDRKRCRAGVGRDGVLTAIVNWVRLTGPAATKARRFKQPVEEMRLHVGGLSRATHRSWVEQDLKVGDRVTVVVARGRSFDQAAQQPRRVPQRLTPRETMFLNVDLDVWSRSPLDALVKALGRQVYSLYAGRDGRRHVAHLELDIQSQDPDRLITRFVKLVKRLPPAERRLWDSAHRREFNIGIQAALGPASYELHLDPATLKAAADVHATIGVTVYGAGLAERPSR